VFVYERAVLTRSRLVHRALASTKWALHMGGEPLAWLRSTFAMYFLQLCAGRGFAVQDRAQHSA
jgi:hypothetical protein